MAMIATQVCQKSSSSAVVVKQRAHAPAAVRRAAGAVAAVILSTGTAASPALAGSVAFPNVSNGAAVGTPVHLEFSVDGMDVRPAKEGIQEGMVGVNQARSVPTPKAFFARTMTDDRTSVGTGHFHLLIDAPETYDAGEAIPFDETHLHYGKAQVAADVPLPPGTHTLTLQFANAIHQSYGEEYRTTITVKAE